MKCEITNKERFKIWNAPLCVEGHIDIPLVFAEHENYLLAPTYLALRSLQGKGGEICTSTEIIACRLGIKLTNKRALTKICDSLNYLIAKEVLYECNVSRVCNTTGIFGYIRRCDEVYKLLGVKKKYALIQAYEIKAYGELHKKYPKLKFFHYITQLARIRGHFGCFCKRQKPEYYLKDSYSLMTLETFESRRVTKVFDAKEWLQIFSDARVFAWATFNRHEYENNKPDRLVAIVNYDTENLIRVQKVMDSTGIKPEVTATYHI